MLKKLIMCSAALILVVLLVISKTDSANTLVLGTMSGWPPFVSISPLGTYEGLDIDIANIIAKRLGKKLVIKDMDTAMLISSLKQGRVDFIMTGLDIKPERTKRMSMIPYQGEPITEYPLVFWKEVPKGISTLSDLKSLPDAVICVESGSSQEEVLKNYEGFSVKNVDPLVSLLELKTGRATASLLDSKMFKTLKDKEPNLVAKMMPLTNNEVILGCGIGIKKGNTDLETAISQIIDDLKQNGMLATLEARWISQDEGAV